MESAPADSEGPTAGPCDPCRGPMLDKSVSEGLHPGEGAHTGTVHEELHEEFIKNYSPWEEFMLEKFMEGLSWEGPHNG